MGKQYAGTGKYNNSDTGQYRFDMTRGGWRCCGSSYVIILY